MKSSDMSATTGSLSIDLSKKITRVMTDAKIIYDFIYSLAFDNVNNNINLIVNIFFIMKHHIFIYWCMRTKCI